MPEEYGMYGLTLWNRVRNEEVRRAQVEEQLSHKGVNVC